MSERSKLKFHRFFWLGFIIVLIIVMLIIPKDKEYSSGLGSCLLVGAFFGLLFFIFSLFLSYKEYYYKGKTISVYAGWCHHTLRVNGIPYDEHTTFSTRVPIWLSTTLEDGTILEATISTWKRITLKANDKLLWK